MKTIWVVLLALAVSTPAAATPKPVHLVQVQTDDWMAWEAAHRTSASRPLTMTDLQEMRRAGLQEATLIELLRTRKLLALASPSLLVDLKKSGASDALISAVSAYAYPPNERISLLIQLNLVSNTSLNQAPNLYVEAWHRSKKRSIGFFHARLDQTLQSANAQVMKNSTDPLLSQTIAALRFMTEIQTQFPGEIDLLFTLSTEPNLTRLTTSKGTPIAGVSVSTLTYPAVSIRNTCRLDLSAQRDPLIPERYALASPRLECRWD